MYLYLNECEYQQGRKSPDVICHFILIYAVALVVITMKVFTVIFPCHRCQDIVIKIPLTYNEMSHTVLLD